VTPASAIPVISAVGHQDNWTIADYVADLRASTPTHAAPLAGLSAGRIGALLINGS
jgi:exodeoxyribonuclease VII large subunit